MRATSSRLTRRSLLTSGLMGAGILAAPALIGRAGIATAKTSFAGEGLIVVSWSGNMELGFRERVIAPFNSKYGTKVETVGGYDQIVPQIMAAPADNPPFDVTIADEFTTISGLAENLFVKLDRSAIPGMSAVYPWFDDMRPVAAREFGVPFNAGSVWMVTSAESGLPHDTWTSLWSDKAAGKISLDGSAFYWDLAITALLSDAMPGIKELSGDATTVEALFARLDQLRVRKWFSDTAEMANLMLQGEAAQATMYGGDVYRFVNQKKGEFLAAIPKEGTASYSNWFSKVRGTRHSELADLFIAYLMERETQSTFLQSNFEIASRKDVSAPAIWPDYPTSNEQLVQRFNLVSIDILNKMLPQWDALTARMKEAVVRSTKS